MCRAEAQNKKEKESKRLHRQKGLLAFPKQTIGGPVITDTALPWSVPYPWVALQPSCGHGDAILPVNTAAGLLGGRALSSFGLAGALLAGRVPQLTVESLFSGTIQRKVTSQFKT
jgi:hypothetical protein